ncbi:MAG: DsbA family protein [Pseudomonadota bacterium]
MSRNLILAALAVVFAAIGGYVFLGGPGGSGAAVGPGLSASAAESVDHSLVLEMALGDEDAAVTVIEYASFTCPHCRRFHEGPFKRLKADYIDTGKIHFIYREVYFDRYALWAGLVARCGGERRYFGLVDLIYRNQSVWMASDDPVQIAESLRRLGRQAGLSDAALEACLQDGDKAQAMVALWQRHSERDDINSTPSFVINGTKYSNMSYADFSALLEEELNG